MVGSNSHVDERRLRPVYDALDNLNNKQAIKLADGILKKQKDCICAKALKALALVRLNKKREGLALLENIKETAQCLDETTLQAMAMSYKESDKMEDIISLYEVAAKQNKDNEEILSHLFMSYVRVCNYAKQQQTAMNLYKAAPKNPYYFWAVMSNIMQGVTSDDDKKRTMFLSLAERMVSKLMKQGKIESQEENDLYLLILQLLGKYEELLSRLDEGKYRKTDLEIECLSKLGRNAELNLCYKNLLADSPDQWSYIKGLIETCLELKDYVPDVPIDTDNKQPIFQVEELTKFLDQLYKENPLVRGPLLGTIELLKMTTNDETQLMEYMVKYFKEFGSKPCCYSDLRSYVGVIGTDNRNKFIENLKSTYSPCKEEASNKEKVNELMKDICIECIAMQMNLTTELSKDEKFAKAKALVSKYNSSLVLGKDLTETELQHGDTLIQLTFYLLLDLNTEKGNDSMIWHIILVLEEAIEKSTTNAHLKLLLVFLYGRIGASSACEKLLQEIEVKYIVYDSCGYLICHPAYKSGQFQLTQRVYDRSFGLYKTTANDIPEQIVSSYRYGSFRQVEEMCRLKTRFEKSSQRYYLSMEQMFVTILQHCNNIIETRKKMNTDFSEKLQSLVVTEENLRELWDNRDVALFERFDQLRDHSEDHKESYSDLLLLIRYRYATLNLLHFCMNARHGEEKQEAELDDTKTRLTEYQQCAALLKNRSFSSSWESVHCPKITDLHHIKEQSHTEIFEKLANLFVLATSKTELDASDVSMFSKTFESVLALMKGIKDGFEKNLIVEGEDVFNGKSLPHIVFFLEISSLVAILVGSLKGMFLLNETGVKTRKKKGSEQKKVNKPLDSIEKFAQECEELLKELHNRLQDIKTNNIEKTLNDKTIMELFEKTNSTTVTKIWDKVQSSYRQSILEINQVLELKIQFFKSFSK